MKRNYKGNPPNPLFEKWLTEMKEQAAERDSPIQHSFGKALSSLRKCPIRLETGQDCLILQHFGKKICDILDKKLEEHKKKNNLPSSSRPSSIRNILGDDHDDDMDVGGKRAKQIGSADEARDGAAPRIERPVLNVPKNRLYMPKVGSGAYAIVTTMYKNTLEPNYQGYQLKRDIISQAQKHCDSPMKANAIEHYSGWSSMSTLISKNYVVKKSNPAKYTLTDSGVALAMHLIEGRAKHHDDSDHEDEVDGNDGSSGGGKKPLTNNKSKKKSTVSSLVYNEDDFAKPSTSGSKNSGNFSDSDDDEFFKQNYMKNLETNRKKTQGPVSLNSDDEFEAAMAGIVSKKPSIPPSEGKSDAAFEDELEMALAMSLNESQIKSKVFEDNGNAGSSSDWKKPKISNGSQTKSKIGSSVSNEHDFTKPSTSGSKNSGDFNDPNDDDFFKQNYMKNLETNRKKTQDPESSNSDDEFEAAIALSKKPTILPSKGKSDAVFEDELEMALAMSLNESQMKHKVAVVQDDDYLVEDEQLKKTDGRDSENDEDLKLALEISMQEFKQKEIPTKTISNHMYNETRAKNDLTNTKKSVPESYKKVMNEDEIICLDDDEDSFDNRLIDNFEFQSKPVDENDDQSFMEFCKENAESAVCIKKATNHFIFTEGPTYCDEHEKNNENSIEKEIDDLEVHNTPERPDNRSNEHFSNKQQNLSPINDVNVMEQIEISDEDDNLDYEIPAKNGIGESNEVDNVEIPTEFDELNKENFQPETNYKREFEFSKFTGIPSTLKDSNPSLPGTFKNLNEKENSQTNNKAKETTEDEPYDSFTLLPDKFDIILLVDTQETSGIKKKPTDDATISELNDAGVLFEVRSLKVGDFAWIARCRLTRTELILPYIIERKRIDDLGGSITDGRYHEQKHRLRQSGIQNVIYLIEHFGKTYHGALPLTSLLQAGINTTVQDGFITKFTKDHRDTMQYLVILTKKFIQMYKRKKLISCPKKYINSRTEKISEDTEHLMEFSEFNKSALKTKKFTVREMLIKQLVQLKGVSSEKAIGIAETYPTPRVLVNALKNGGKNLLADIEVGSSRRKIGPTISNVLHMYYTKTNFN